MKFYLILLFSILVAGNTYAQKGIEELSQNKIDSLRSEHVDTIIWYHSYCGECEILSRPDISKPNTPIRYSYCTVLSGYTLTNNIILYKQKGNYFLLNFDCNNLIIKRQLDTCKSISYFISIIPTLYARDKTITAMHRRGEFLGPMQTDGSFEEADIYFHQTKQHISMSDIEKTPAYKKYFWAIKQIKLFELISADIAVKKP